MDVRYRSPSLTLCEKFKDTSITPIAWLPSRHNNSKISVSTELTQSSMAGKPYTDSLELLRAPAGCCTGLHRLDLEELERLDLLSEVRGHNLAAANDALVARVAQAQKLQQHTLPVTARFQTVHEQVKVRLLWWVVNLATDVQRSKQQSPGHRTRTRSKSMSLTNLG